MPYTDRRSISPSMMHLTFRGTSWPSRSQIWVAGASVSRTTTHSISTNGSCSL